LPPLYYVSKKKSGASRDDKLVAAKELDGTASAASRVARDKHSPRYFFSEILMGHEQIVFSVFLKKPFLVALEALGERKDCQKKVQPK
jgi:hypothetical protein